MAEEKKILIVDDDPVVLRTMKEGLSEDYRVYGANSGANALKILGKMPVDLVLLDYEMPEMNGRETLLKIRETEALRDLPVLFLTGLTAPDLTGLDVPGYLQKGIPLSEIRERVAAMFGD